MDEHLKTRLKRTGFIVTLGLLIGAGIGYMQAKNERVATVTRVVEKASVPGSAAGGPFALIDETGALVTEADFPGYKLIYFGFTYCPAICPTELRKMTQALTALGPEGAKITPVFISIDPGRDTPAVLKEYVALFDARLKGLTGTSEQIEQVKKDYRIYAKKVQEPEMSDYTMDHSSFIYLMSPDNRLIAIYRTADTADFMAADIRSKISGG